MEFLVQAKAPCRAVERILRRCAISNPSVAQLFWKYALPCAGFASFYQVLLWWWCTSTVLCKQSWLFGTWLRGVWVTWHFPGAESSHRPCSRAAGEDLATQTSAWSWSLEKGTWPGVLFGRSWWTAHRPWSSAPWQPGLSRCEPDFVGCWGTCLCTKLPATSFGAHGGYLCDHRICSGAETEWLAVCGPKSAWQWINRRATQWACCDLLFFLLPARNLSAWV